MRNFEINELLQKAKKADGYIGIPDGVWILGIRSNTDIHDAFDDKFYLFKGECYLMNLTGTTNSGTYGLLNFHLWNKNGTAVLKTNQWSYDCWKEGLHKGKMRALVQVGKMYYYRDNDKDSKNEELGKLLYDKGMGINYHTVSYDKKKNFIGKLIGQWSVGCQCPNNVEDYYKSLDLIPKGQLVSYCLIKEF